MNGHFDAIVHLAGQTMVGSSIDDPAHDAAQNILGTIRVLEAARQSGVYRARRGKALRPAVAGALPRPGRAATRRNRSPAR